ncbi:MAG: flavin reductase [Solirubrobacterales bacterium]|nr:flavin reductase [Solirubrobacterales bacterium]
MDKRAAFDALMGSLDERAFIVTVRHGETRAGCLIGFGGQVSIDPQRFLACLSDKNRTYRVAARGAEHLGVHLLPAGRRDLAELFGGETGDDVDKFARCAWHEGPGGVPLLDDCPDRFVGRVLEHRPLGDHVGFLLEPVAAAYAGAEPMPVGDAVDIEAGHDA